MGMYSIKFILGLYSQTQVMCSVKVKLPEHSTVQYGGYTRRHKYCAVWRLYSSTQVLCNMEVILPGPSTVQYGGYTPGPKYYVVWQLYSQQGSYIHKIPGLSRAIKAIYRAFHNANT